MSFKCCIMFGMHTLKNCVHLKQSVITVHTFGDAKRNCV